MIERRAKDFATIDYVYIVDGERVLRGVVSIKELLATAEPDVKVEEVMKKELVTVHPLTHQERVVYLALFHSLEAIPVVDREGHLLGVIPYDTILQIFNEEVREDTFKFGGIFQSRQGVHNHKVSSFGPDEKKVAMADCGGSGRHGHCFHHKQL